jgi:hypothetical protein
MNRLEVELQDGQSVFAPGETIRGVARWELDETPTELEVRLFWYTEGKGDQDVAVVDTVTRQSPPAEGELRFSLTAPRAPSSFSGRLISLVWAVELVVQPGGGAARTELLLSHTGREIRLDTTPQPEP